MLTYILSSLFIFCLHKIFYYISECRKIIISQNCIKEILTNFNADIQTIKNTFFYLLLILKTNLIIKLKSMSKNSNWFLFKYLLSTCICT